MAVEQIGDKHDHRAWKRANANLDRLHDASRWPWWMLDAAKTRQQTLPPTSTDELAQITLPDQDGHPIRLGELWRDQPAVVVWLRQFGCPFCRAYASRLNWDRRKFVDAGASITLIGQGTPADATAFRHHLAIGLPVLADASRVSYLAAGTKLATLGELIAPAVVAKALVAMARQRVVLGRNTADEAQLGGTMIIRPDGQVHWAHISEDASDMAPPAEVLAALRTIPVRSRRA